MTMSRRTALAVLASAALSGWVTLAAANDRTVFSGCVTERGDKTITLKTSGDESIQIDTSWLKPEANDVLTADCMTVTTTLVEGKYMAESVEEGDEPNDVHSDRVQHEKEDEREEKDDDE
jgi:hypothetical protein